MEFVVRGGFDNVHIEGKHRIILAAFCYFDTILKQYRENNEIDIITVNGRGDMKIKRLLFDKNPENQILSKKEPFYWVPALCSVPLQEYLTSFFMTRNSVFKDCLHAVLP